MMKMDLKKQLTALKQEELLAIKGGKDYIPADFYVPTGPSFGIWEEVSIRFDNGQGSFKDKLTLSHAISSNLKNM